MSPLLVLGPDSTLRDVHALARQAYPGRRVDALPIPVSDYYHFDLSGLADFPPGQWQVCVAVNEFYINDVRRALHASTAALGYSFASVVSPGASISPTATIADNAIIHAGCVVGADSRIGLCAVLRPNVVLSEDVVVGDYVTLEANVAIREGARVGNFSTICANSSLARMTEVGPHCYLNHSRQYGGKIPQKTFYSPLFENPVRVFCSDAFA